MTKKKTKATTTTSDAASIGVGMKCCRRDKTKKQNEKGKKTKQDENDPKTMFSKIFDNTRFDPQMHYVGIAPTVGATKWANDMYERLAYFRGGVPNVLATVMRPSGDTGYSLPTVVFDVEHRNSLGVVVGMIDERLRGRQCIVHMAPSNLLPELYQAMPPICPPSLTQKKKVEVETDPFDESISPPRQTQKKKVDVKTEPLNEFVGTEVCKYLTQKLCSAVPVYIAVRKVNKRESPPNHPFAPDIAEDFKNRSSIVFQDFAPQVPAADVKRREIVEEWEKADASDDVARVDDAPPPPDRQFHIPEDAYVVIGGRRRFFAANTLDPLDIPEMLAETMKKRTKMVYTLRVDNVVSVNCVVSRKWTPTRPAEVVPMFEIVDTRVSPNSIFVDATVMMERNVMRYRDEESFPLRTHVAALTL